MSTTLLKPDAVRLALHQLLDQLLDSGEEKANAEFLIPGAPRRVRMSLTARVWEEDEKEAWRQEQEYLSRHSHD